MSLPFTRLLLAILILAALPGCTTHLYNLPQERTAPTITTPLKGEISKTQGLEHRDILQSSGIVDNSGSSGNQIYIEEIKPPFFCGMPLLGSAITLGIVPA